MTPTYANRIAVKTNNETFIYVLLVCVAIAGILVAGFLSSITEDGKIVLRKDERGHPYYTPAGILGPNYGSDNRFINHYVFLSDAPNFNKGDYERKHLGDEVYPENSGANPGEKTIHLFTNNDPDPDIFRVED